MAETPNAPAPEPKAPETPETPPVETFHTLQLGDRTLTYSAHAGMMALRSPDTNDHEANIFYTAYQLVQPVEGAEKPQPQPARPLIFVFNGGPGSASVWLHLGALGPHRVRMEDEGWMPPPPYQLVPNEHTWLDMADLVFVDPVGTGYSRAVKADDSKKYWNLSGDLDSLTEFIRLFLTRYERWSSPLYLAGESYGTTRAAGLSKTLFEHGIALNGLFLISTVLNFQTIDPGRGNDLPFGLFVPTYAATAWYHKRLADDLQQRPLRDFLREVESWAEDEYTRALAQGDHLSKARLNAVARRLARYIGLPVSYVLESKLRVMPGRFFKALLRDQGLTVGRLDSRFIGRDALPVTEFPEFDPSMSGIIPPYTAMMNDYARRVLGYKTDAEYHVLSFKVNGGWEWDRGAFPDTSEMLRSAFAQHPHMRAFVAMGLYDLATPHLGTIYTFDHMDLAPDTRAQIVMADYEAGHMMYLDVRELAKLKADAAAFLNG